MSLADLTRGIVRICLVLNDDLDYDDRRGIEDAQLELAVRLVPEPISVSVREAVLHALRTPNCKDCKSRYGCSVKMAITIIVVG